MTFIRNDVKNIKWPPIVGGLIFSSTDAYQEKILIGHISAEKRDMELQPTGMVIRY